MHTVELLEHALEAAQRLGFKVRQDWLGGGCGICELRGQRWIFLDVSLPPAERLAVVVDALRNEPGLNRITLPAPLARLLDTRWSA